MDWIIRAATWVDGAIWTAAPFIGFIILWLAVFAILVIAGAFAFVYWPCRISIIPRRKHHVAFRIVTGRNAWPIRLMVGIESRNTGFRNMKPWFFGLVLLEKFETEKSL